MAAGILKVARQIVDFECGGDNTLIFYMWMLGCSMPIPKDANGNCLVPPNLPGFVLDYVDQVISAQPVYAEQYGENPICPLGYVLDPATNLCCNATTGCLAPPPCQANTDCGPGQICQNGLCRTPCSPTSACPSGQVCANGICATLCDASHPCPPGESCVNGVCVPPSTPAPGGSPCDPTHPCPPGQTCVNGVCVTPGGAPSGGSVLPWVVAIGLPAIWAGAARLHELGKI
jgi:hypothetical protein